MNNQVNQSCLSPHAPIMLQGLLFAKNVSNTNQITEGMKKIWSCFIILEIWIWYSRHGYDSYSLAYAKIVIAM